MSSIAPATWLGFALQAALVLSLGWAAASVLRARAASTRHLAWTAALALTLVLPLLAAALPDVDLPVTVPPSWSAAVDSTAVAGASSVRSVSAAPTPGSGGASILSSALLGGWLAGALLLAARLVASHLGLARLRHRAQPIRQGVAVELLERALAAAGCRRRPQLLSSDLVRTPATFGVCRPAVVLPAGWHDWPRARLRIALLHEVWHVRRHDAASRLLGEVVRVLHWFDPVAWLAVRSLARERERACDDAVLAAGVRAVDYAGEILASVRDLDRHAVPGGVLALVWRRRSGDLERRLRAILDHQVPAGPAPRAHGVWLVATLTAGAVAVASLALAPRLAALSPFALDDPLSELVPGDPPLARFTPKELATAPDRAAIERLIEAARREKSWTGDLVAERARWALARASDGEVVRPLLAALTDGDWRVQAYAAWGLAVAGDRRAIAPVMALLEHPVWRVRAQAVGTLAQLRAEVPFAQLQRLADDPAWQVRIGVVDHLAARGDDASRLLLARLAGDRHAGVRGHAAAAVASRSVREPG